MSFVDGVILQCPYFGGSTSGGSTVVYCRKFFLLIIVNCEFSYIHKFTNINVHLL